MKKFLSVLLALCMSCIFLVLPASANPVGMIKDISRFVSDVWEISEQYENGDISQSEFFNKFTSSMVRFDINYGADVTSFKDVLNVFEFCGVDVPDKWQEWFYENKMGGDGSGGHRDDSILNGYSCSIIFYSSDGEVKYVMSGNGGKIIPQKSGSIWYCLSEYFYTASYRTSNGSLISASDSHGFNDGYMRFDGYPAPTLYGDWRYEDGSSADDVITELPEKQIPTFDDESVSDDDIIDFLKDLLQELMLQFPDLSTVEGLLRAILSQLGTLDSDNDNELLCSILTAIQALKSSDNPEASEDITDCLEDIKNDLVYNDGENSLTLAEQLNSLVENQIKLSDITIDESLYNQRFELIQTKLLGKFSFISEMKNFIDYALSAYSSSTSPNISFSIFGNSYNIDFSAFDDSIDLIRFCIAAFCYLSFAFVTFRKIPSYINGGDNL